MRYFRFGGHHLGFRHPAVSDRLSGYKFWFPILENMGVGFGTVFLSGIQAELWSTSGLGGGHLVFGFPLCRTLFGMS